MPETDEPLAPATAETGAAAPAASRRPRRRVVWGSVAGALVLAVGVTGVALAHHNSTLTQQAELRAQWGEDVEAWQVQGLALVPEPAVRLAPLVSGAATETGEGIASITAECERAAAAATAVASPPAAPPAPEGLPETADGVAEITDRITTSETALAAYATTVDGAASDVAGLCALYPGLAQASLDQASGIAALRGQLGECELAEIGCLPRDAATWATIADGITAAYTDPEQRRATLWTDSCPSEALAEVCATQAGNAQALVPLYEQYAQAVREGADPAVTAARDALTAQLAAGDAALLTAAAPLMGEGVTDPGVAVAQAMRQIAVDADAAWLEGDGALMVALD